MSRFLEEIENSFVAEGFLEKHGTLKRWSVSFMDEFEAQSTGFVLRRVDLVGWLNVSAGDGICDAIVLFDNLFNTTLCDPLQLAGLCPAVCGLCGVHGVRNTRQSMPELVQTQKSLLSSGVLTVQLIDGNVKTLECGENATGAVEEEDSSHFVFNLTQTDLPFVFFSLCSQYTDFDTVLTVKDSDGNFMGYSDDYCDYQSASLVQNEVENQDYDYLIITVEGYRGVGGQYELSTECLSFPPSSWSQSAYMDWSIDPDYFLAGFSVDSSVDSSVHSSLDCAVIFHLAASNAVSPRLGICPRLGI